MKIELWGRGGEIVVGTISREKYTYWQLRADGDDEVISNELQQWDDDDESEEVPEELKLGSWYDIDDLAHESGPSIDFCSIKVTSDDGKHLWEGDLSDLTSQEGLEDLAEEVEEFYFAETDHKYGFWAYDSQKGLFDTYTVEGVNEWNPRLFKVEYADIEGNSIVTNIKYDGKDLEGDGSLDTDGKGWDWGFIVNGEEEELTQ